MRLLVAVMFLLTPVPLMGQQVDSVAIRVCPDSAPFSASAAARGLVVHGRVLVPPRIVVGQPHAVRLEVLEVLKGRLDAPVINVHIGAGSEFREGEEWLLALPGAGTLYLEGCGVHAVLVRNGQAIGRIESMDSHQIVPLDRLRLAL